MGGCSDRVQPSVAIESDSYDVVIVGAGVAGCAAALSLPRGTRALLVDRTRQGAERCCGGLLTSDAHAALLSLGLALPDSVRVQPEPRYVHAHDLDSGRQQSYRRDYLNLDRARFDAWLIGLAADHVDLALQTRFSGTTGDDVVLHHGDRSLRVRTKLLIGADGATSTVRRQCFGDLPLPTTMIAMQATLEAGSWREAGGVTSEPSHVVCSSPAS